MHNRNEVVRRITGIVACAGVAAAMASGCGSDSGSSCEGTNCTAVDSGTGDGSPVGTMPTPGTDSGPIGDDDDTRADASFPDASGATDGSTDLDASDAAVAAITSHLSIDGVINAIVHAGSSWYVGGGFSRASNYAAGNLLPLDATGTPVTCALGTGFDGPVAAVAQAGTSIYVGGNFTHYQGSSASHLAKIDATSCALDTTFSPAGANGFESPVTALAVDGTSVYVGGSFTTYRGVASSANHVAKLDLVSGAIDTTFSPAGATANGFDSTVEALLVAGNQLYIGGTFSAYRGVATSANRLAKVDPTTGVLDTTFSPNTSATSNGFNSIVNALATDGTSLYVGGLFTAYKGVASSANLLAKLNLTTGAIDTAFSPVGATSNGFTGAPGMRGPGAEVFALACVNDSIYVGGRFTAYRGAYTTGNANRIAKLFTSSGALDTTFSPAPGIGATNGFDNTVEALATSGSSLYVGGVFTSYRSVANSASGLAKLDLGTGVQDMTYIPTGSTANGIGLGGGISTEVFVGDTLWIGGSFSVYAGTAVANLAKIDDTTYALDTTFSPAGATANGVDGTVIALAASATSLYVGGSFTAYRGVANSARSLAKVDLTTGAIDTTFSPVNGAATDNGFLLQGTNGPVDALAVSSTALFVGGQFDSYRGVANSASNLAKLDLVTGLLDTTFSPNGVNANGFDSSVNALVVAGTSVYCGGGFTKYKGVTASAESLAKLDTTSGAIDTTFSPPGASMNGFGDSLVFALAANGTSLYVGGSFSAYRGVANSANGVAKLDLTSGALDTTFSPVGATANGFGTFFVSSLAIVNGSLYAAGDMSAYRGVVASAEGLAKLDLTTGAIDTTFSPVGATANGFNGAAYGIAATSKAIAVGGQFTVYRGGPVVRSNLDFLDPTSGAPVD